MNNDSTNKRTAKRIKANGLEFVKFDTTVRSYVKAVALIVFEVSTEPKSEILWQGIETTAKKCGIMNEEGNIARKYLAKYKKALKDVVLQEQKANA